MLRNNKKRMCFLLFFGTITALLLIFKNSIITGYPLYPFNVLPLKTAWTIPEDLLKFVVTITENSGYFKYESPLNPTLFIKVNSWFQLGGINRIFNLGMLALFILGFFVKKNQTHFSYKILYSVLVLNFILLFLSSPQYRYFLPEYVFLFILVTSTIFNYLKIDFKTVQYLFLGGIIAPLFLTEIINFPNLAINKLHQEKEKNNWSQILIPKKASKYADIKFEKIKEGNLDYYSPKENFFFYGTANGKLPCVNKVQIQYLKKKYHIKPQLRTSYLGDGFYSKKISQNE